MDDEPERFKFTPDKLLTSKARNVSSIMKRGSIETAIKLAHACFVVIGPGEGNEGFESRAMIKDLIEKEKKQAALFPEKVSPAQLRDILAAEDMRVQDLDSYVRNPVAKGYLLMRCTDIAIMLLTSPGVVSEFSAYFTMKDVPHKIRLYYPAKFSGKQSFIRSGPIELFNDVYKQVFTFRDDEELRLKVSEMVDNHLIYLSITKF